MTFLKGLIPEIICQTAVLNLMCCCLIKESQDVQESFKHLEAWYDENVS